jgi:hypothetical protein
MTEFDDYECKNIRIELEGMVIDIADCKVKNIEDAILFAIKEAKKFRLLSRDYISVNLRISHEQVSYS